MNSQGNKIDISVDALDKTTKQKIRCLEVYQIRQKFNKNTDNE
jgi:hypothetical protein